MAELSAEVVSNIQRTVFNAANHITPLRPDDIRAPGG